MVFLDKFFFSYGGQKKCLLVTLDRRSTYTVIIVWELAWADSAMVVLASGHLIEVVIYAGLAVYVKKYIKFLGYQRQKLL